MTINIKLTAMIEFTKCDKGFYPLPAENYKNGNIILSSHNIVIKPGEMVSIPTGLIMRHQINHYIKVVPIPYYEPLLDIINMEEHNSINPHSQFFINVRNKTNNTINIIKGNSVVEVIELHQQFGKLELINIPIPVEDVSVEDVSVAEVSVAEVSVEDKETEFAPIVPSKKKGRRRIIG